MPFTSFIQYRGFVVAKFLNLFTLVFTIGLPIVDTVVRPGFLESLKDSVVVMGDLLFTFLTDSGVETGSD